MYYNLFLDDEREPDENFVRVTSADEAIAFLKAYKVLVFSADHDLGSEDPENNGYIVLRWIEREVILNGFIPPKVIKVHSANPVGRQRMEAAIDSIYKHAKANLKAKRRSRINTRSSAIRKITDDILRISCLAHIDYKLCQCSCMIWKLVENAKILNMMDDLPEIAVQLFFNLLIDETVYYILVDGYMNQDNLGNDDLYEEYRLHFPFVKIWEHHTANHASPYIFLDPNNKMFNINNIKNLKLIEMYYHIYWGNGVKRFLINKGYSHAAELIESEFYHDFTLEDRYPAEIGKLLTRYCNITQTRDLH